MKTMERLLKRFADRLEPVQCLGTSIWREYDGSRASYWASLKDGWVCRSTLAGSCHESTLRDLEAALKAAYKPAFSGTVSVSTVSDEEAMQAVDDICRGEW
jgi:hypothetical protein